MNATSRRTAADLACSALCAWLYVSCLRCGGAEGADSLMAGEGSPVLFTAPSVGDACSARGSAAPARLPFAEQYAASLTQTDVGQYISRLLH